jgi:large subunit ribosomal protein L19
MNILAESTAHQLRTNLPEFKAGDTVKVHLKIKEGDKERIQVFEGVVIARRKKSVSIDATFTMRKISGGVGVERNFMLHSPMIDKIEVVRRGSVRRAKLYYLRHQRGDRMKIKQQRLTVQQSSALKKKTKVNKPSDETTPEDKAE